MKLKRIFLKYVMIYVLFLTITTSVLVPIIRRHIDITVESKVDSMFHNMKSEFQSYENLLLSVHELQAKLVLDEDLAANYMHSDINQAENIYSILKIKKKIQDLTYFFPESIVDYQMVFNNGTIITSARIYDNFENFYETEFLYEGMNAKTYQKTIEVGKMVLAENQIRTNLKHTVRPVITLKAIKNETFTFLIYLNTDNIFNQYVLNQTGGFACLFDSQGNLLAQRNPNALTYTLDIQNNTSIELKNNTVLFSFSDPVYFTKIVYGIPVSFFYEFSNPIIMGIYLYFGSAILFCLILACIFAMHQVKRFRQIDRFLQDNDLQGDDTRNEYFTIISALKKMRTINTKLIDEHNRINDSFMLSIFEHLLLGNSVDKNSIMEFQSRYFVNRTYRLVLIDFENLSIEEKWALYLSIQKTLSRQILFDLFNNYFLLLQEETPAFEKDVEEFRQKIIQNSDINFTISISSTISSVYQLKNSYDEVKMINFYNKNGLNQVICKFQEKSNAPIPFSISNADEDRISEILLSGNTSEFLKEWTALAQHLVNENNLNTDNMIQIFYTLKKIVLNITMKMDLPCPKILSFDVQKDWSAQLNALVTASLKVCEDISERKSTSKKNLTTQVLEYIKQNFNDPNICITAIAEKLNISKNYISILLKEATGQSYSSYLTELRINESKKLLCETQMNLANIGETVGYLDPNTFYKAFRRLCGISPKKFRENNCGQ